MTDMAERMQQRMALVEKLSALNAKQLQNTQARSGIEVELTACIESIEENGESKAALATAPTSKPASRWQWLHALTVTRSWIAWQTNSRRWISSE